MENLKLGHTTPCVCVDAGHYGKYNRSPVVAEYWESERMWKLHILLRAELEKLGVPSIATRADPDADRDLVERGKASKNCDALLSLHSNADKKEGTNYVVAYYQVDDHCGEMDKQSLELAGRLSECVAEIMGVEAQYWATQSSADRDGNGYKDDYYGVLRGAHAVHTPAVILEHGFHTNPEQARWLLDDANLQKLAEAEAKVIADWFGVGEEKKPEQYDQKEFVRRIQTACGAKVDGIAGKETLSKTVTISASFNRKHPVVAAVQEYLYFLGYTEVGKADGIAGSKFTAALAHFQQDHDCTPTGIAEEWGKTWQKLLGLA